MSDTFHQRYLGLFKRPLLDISGRTFVFKGKTYSLSDVSRVRLAGGHGQPMQLGRLSDGRTIRVHSGVLIWNGVRFRNGFYSGTNEAFDWLRAFFSAPGV
ncbi:MAG: hypothetical protein MI745_05565 [Pseudomonadales bacterium]|nr:hypothetical protein [Pseudomonadales bacterium]